MSTISEENKELLGQFLAAIEEQDWAAYDEALAADVLTHVFGEDILGRDALKDIHKGYVAAFPDITFTIEDILAEDDRVVARTTFSGTHEGAFEGIDPTGEEVEGRAISIARVEDGALTELWVVQDQLGILQQLGVMEAP